MFVPENLVVAKPGERVRWEDAILGTLLSCTATADYQVIDGVLFRRFAWFTSKSGEQCNESWLEWLQVPRRFDQPDTGPRNERRAV